MLFSEPPRLRLEKQRSTAPKCKIMKPEGIPYRQLSRTSACPPDVPAKVAINIVYMHGRSENYYTCINRMERTIDTLVGLIPDPVDVNLTVFDYPGYGDSSAATPRTEEDVNAFARAACGRIGFPPREFSRQINIIWGYSIGTGPATRVAADACIGPDPGFDIDAIFLQAPFDSIFSCSSGGRSLVGAAMYALNRTGADLFESGRLIGGLKTECPDIVIAVKHAEQDELIPLRENSPRFKDAADIYAVVPDEGHEWFISQDGEMDACGTLAELVEFIRGKNSRG